MNLLEYWSWFGSEVSHTTRVLTFFMARFKNAKQKSKTDKKSLEITGGCVCKGEGADLTCSLQDLLRQVADVRIEVVLEDLSAAADAVDP